MWCDRRMLNMTNMRIKIQIYYNHTVITQYLKSDRSSTVIAIHTRCIYSSETGQTSIDKRIFVD